MYDRPFLQLQQRQQIQFPTIRKQPPQAAFQHSVHSVNYTEPSPEQIWNLLMELLVVQKLEI
jgi:hypothetical protein